MGWWKAQVNLQDIDQLPRDRYVNVFNLWHSSSPEPTLLELGNSAKAFGDFYNGMSNFISGAVDRVTSDVRFYDMSLPKETPPVRQQGLFQQSVGGSNPSTVAPLPTEVACCLTLVAVPLSSSTITKILRGRLYIGPLTQDTVTTTEHATEHHSRVTQDFRDSLVTHAIALQAQLQAQGFEWVIHSPRRGYVLPIDSFKVDDSWDIQRRRGDQPTANSVGVPTDPGAILPVGIGVPVVQGVP